MSLEAHQAGTWGGFRGQAKPRGENMVCIAKEASRSGDQAVVDLSCA